MHKHRKPITLEEAAEKITALVMELAAEESELDENGEPVETTLAAYLAKRQTLLNFYVKKFVLMVLAYCHRHDIPESLLYVIVDAILTLLRSQLAAAQIDSDSASASEGPLSEIKLGDSQYKFDTSARIKFDTSTKNAIQTLNLTKIASDEFFNSLTSQLNLFRRIKAH